MHIYADAHRPRFSPLRAVNVPSSRTHSKNRSTTLSGNRYLSYIRAQQLRARLSLSSPYYHDGTSPSTRDSQCLVVGPSAAAMTCRFAALLSDSMGRPAAAIFNSLAFLGKAFLYSVLISTLLSRFLTEGL